MHVYDLKILVLNKLSIKYQLYSKSSKIDAFDRKIANVTQS